MFGYTPRRVVVHWAAIYHSIAGDTCILLLHHCLFPKKTCVGGIQTQTLLTDKTHC